MLPTFSATLHSYNFRLWPNYGYGKKKVALHPESSWLSGKRSKERNVMSNSNNNQINIPQAREAGSVGGQMVCHTNLEIREK